MWQRVNNSPVTLPPPPHPPPPPQILIVEQQSGAWPGVYLCFSICLSRLVSALCFATRRACSALASLPRLTLSGSATPPMSLFNLMTTALLSALHLPSSSSTSSCIVAAAKMTGLIKLQGLSVTSPLRGKGLLMAETVATCHFPYLTVLTTRRRK